MDSQNDNYLENRKNIYSQNGEDGVLEILLKNMNISENGKCCEFGAWDGKHFSNTYRLVKENMYKALYIESDKDKFEDLLKTRDEHPDQITPVCAYVSNNLDDLLKEHGFFDDLDILSIDIDSSDYEVWKESKCMPKIVIIEPDNNVPLWIKTPIYPVRADGGANPFILKELAKEKGYKFVCTTGNLIFVRNDINVPSQTDVEFPWWLDQNYKNIIYFFANNARAIPEEILICIKGVKLGRGFETDSEELKSLILFLTNFDNNTLDNIFEEIPKYIKGSMLGYKSLI